MRIRLKNARERKDSIPDTEALNSLPSQILTQENENNAAFSNRLDPADAAKRAAHQVGTSTPELEDYQKI